jgi:Cu(I)/Ag(I) efflux system membrane fusion protein
MYLVESKTAPGAGGDEERDHSAADMGERPVPGLMPVTMEPRRLQMIGVRTARVESRPLGGAIRLVGYLTPDETRTASVHVRVSGWVRSLHVDQTGQEVEAGETLLSLYSQDLYAAGQDLLVATAASAAAGDDAVLRGARERLVAAARDRLELLGMSRDDIAALEKGGVAQPEVTLRSPFAGVVLEKAVWEGQYVMPEATLFTIADLRTIWVLADVYEQDIARVKPGQRARMKVGAFPGETFEGKVAFLYPTVSEQTRTLKVRIEFPNPSRRLRPGMYSDVELLDGRRPGTSVPAEAVMDGGDMQYAFVVHGGREFEPRRVSVGRRGGDWIEILSGLHEGETVVTSANFLIDSESRLKAAIAGMGRKRSPEHQH